MSYIREAQEQKQLDIPIYLYNRMNRYSTRQAAKKLGVSLMTIQRYIAAKKIPTPPLRNMGNVRIGLWMAAVFEVGCTYGWRYGSLLKMRVKQVDANANVIRLEPGTTKNKKGLEVTMPRRVR